MKIFLDSTNIDDILRIRKYGILSGILTTPSTIAQANRPLENVLSELCRTVPDCLVFCEVISTQHDKMVDEAKILSSIGSNIVVNLPMSTSGLQAAKTLSDRGMQCGCSLIFSASQAILAAQSGAEYIIPFGGDLGGTTSGADLISDIAEIFSNYSISSKVIATGLHTPQQAVKYAKEGIYGASLQPSAILDMIKHPLTDALLKRYGSDWEKLLEQL